MNIKHILILLVTLVTLFACHNEEMINPQVQGLQVNADFLKLSDNNGITAGNLVINADVPEVTIKWNTGSLCNLDTAQTTLELSKGRAILPIKWMGKLESGTYGPEGVAFKAGVQIIAGKECRYVPLVWAEKIDSTEILKSAIQTRAAGDVMPRVAQISLIPLTVNMNDVNGGSMYVGLTDVSFAILDVSEITSDLNIDMTKIPNYITTSQMLDFKWTAAGAPKFGFSVNIVFLSEGLSPSGIINYTPGGVTPGTSLNYVNSTLPTGNIPKAGGSYTFTFEGTYTGGVQLRVLANGTVIATGVTVTNKQPVITIPQNTTTANRNLTFQYKRDDGNWVDLPVSTNKIQSGSTEGILLAGLIWAPGNLKYNNGTYTFMDSQDQYTGVAGAYWSSTNNTDYWAHNTLTPSLTSLNNGDPCSKVKPEGTWRIGTYDNYVALFNNNPSKYGQNKNGVFGYFVGTSVIPSIETQDNFLFFPMAGKRENGYMTGGGGETYYRWKDTWVPEPFLKTVLVLKSTGLDVLFVSADIGAPIRCVRNP